MVTLTNLTFPQSQSTALSTTGTLIATVNVPYHSTDGSSKLITCTVPVGFSMSLTVYTAGADTITVSNIVTPTTINVYKNGVLVGTTPQMGTNSGATSKSFVLANVSALCSFNSYFYTLNFQYYPQANTTAGNTDVYTFYAPLTWTMAATRTPIVYNGSLPITYGMDINTTITTSSFTNFSYLSGSVDTTGYIAYSLTQQISYASAWNGSQANSYYPTTLYSLWTGFYQLAVLYANNIWVTNGINFKNTGVATNIISWFDSDTNGSNALSLIYASLSSNAMNFFISAPSKLTNGFIFTGGNIGFGYTSLPTFQNTQLGYQGSNSTILTTASQTSSITIPACKTAVLPVGVWYITTTCQLGVSSGQSCDLGSFALSLSSTSGANGQGLVLNNYCVGSGTSVVYSQIINYNGYTFPSITTSFIYQLTTATTYYSNCQLYFALGAVNGCFISAASITYTRIA